MGDVGKRATQLREQQRRDWKDAALQGERGRRAGESYTVRLGRGDGDGDVLARAGRY